MVYHTQYKLRINVGKENSGILTTHHRYYDVQRMLLKIAHPLKQGSFELIQPNKEQAISSYFLADAWPIVKLELLAIKWIKDGIGEIYLCARQFDKKRILRKLDEIAKECGFQKPTTIERLT